MIKSILIVSLGLCLTANAMQTQSSASTTKNKAVDMRSSRGATGASQRDLAINQDKHGNYIYERDVTIKTKNYKVKNFWKNFSFDSKNAKAENSYDVTKTGTVRISVEATSLCTKYPELDEKGCSGQKPFFINNEVLSGKKTGDIVSLMFQKDYNGFSPFSSAGILYDSTDASVFYPLDIDRNEKYYKEIPGKTHTFYSFFGRLFNGFFGDGNFFSSFFSRKVASQGSEVVDVRKKYIANVVSGVDQNHLLSLGKPVSTTALNTPVSLIDYSEVKNKAGGCRLFFFKYSENSKFCNFFSFFSKTEPSVSYKIDMIQADTENSLITFASAYNDKNVTVIKSKATSIVQPKSTSFFAKIIAFFFGSPSNTETISAPIETIYDFTADGNTPININLAVTNDGKKVDSFQTFKLNKIHSISNARQWCRVDMPDSYEDIPFAKEGWDKSSSGFFGLGGSSYSTTFVPTKDKNVAYTNNVDSGDYCHKWSRDYRRDANNKCKKSRHNRNGVMANPKSTDWWLSWCDEAMQSYLAEDPNNTPTVEECTTDKAGFFGKILFGKSDTTSCVQVPVTLTKDGYTINYVNDSKKGLMLDLELVKLNLNSKAITKRYKLMGTK